MSGCGLVLLAGVVGRAPRSAGDWAALPDGPPPSVERRAPETLELDEPEAPTEASGQPALEGPANSSETALLEVIARLPEGLATAPIEVEHLWLPPGVEPDATFLEATRGEPRAWQRARSSSYGGAVFTLAELKPGQHLFRLRGRGSSVEVFGPFDLVAGQQATLEAALWPGGRLNLELLDAEGRPLPGDELSVWVAEAFQGRGRQASPRAPRQGERLGQRFEFKRLAEGWQTVVLRNPEGLEFELPPVEVGLYGSPAHVSFEVRDVEEPGQEGANMGMQMPAPMGRL